MRELLKLARETLNAHFNGKRLDVEENVKIKFGSKQACFVTLTKNSKLRGCVGSLYPKQELWKDVVGNTLNAAFYDTRFLPLTKEELKDIKIEISILSMPKKLDFKDTKDLLKKLNRKQGVIIQKDSFIATFLPQVWDELPKKQEFLSHLCLKAGLLKDSWKYDKALKIYIYSVKKVSEQD